MARTRLPSRRSAAVAAAALLVGLTGCAAAEEPSPKPAASETAGGDTGGDTAAASKPGVAEIDPEDVLVSQTVAVPGSAKDTADIGIHSLTVDGDVQVLRLVITPHFESLSKNEAVNIYKIWGEGVFSPQLVDMENLKVYSVISDTGQGWASDSVFTEGTNGQPFSAWAVFAAPEDDIESFDVRLNDNWPEFTDVPVTR